MNKEVEERLESIRHGDIPKAYQSKECYVIPSEWSIMALKEGIVDIESGVSVNSEEDSQDGRGYRVLKVGCIQEGKFIPTESKQIKNEESSKAKVNPSKGCIIVSRANTPELVGSLGYVEQDYNDLFLSDKLWQLKVKEMVEAKWIIYVLALPEMKRKISLLATGTSKSMQNISKENFLSIKIPIASIKEQKKIVEIISTWDKAIELKEKFLNEKLMQRQGISQRLLIGDIKIDGYKEKWRTILLKEVIEFPKKSPIKKCSQYKLLTVKLYAKGIELTNNKPNLTEKGRPYYLREPNEILIGRQNFHNGGVGIVTKEMKGYVASNAISSLRVKSGNTMFYYYYLSDRRFYKKLDKLVGGTGQKEISETMISKLKIRIPINLEEQKSIATIIECMDKEITLLKKEIVALKDQKKGLMQLLLTGIVRVQIEE